MDYEYGISILICISWFLIRRSMKWRLSTASIRSKRIILLKDENNSLWSAVLYGISYSSDQIVTVALSQVGNVGGEPYWSWYGFGSRVEWCACFVSWCANECGYIDTGVIQKFAGCVNGVQWFKDRGQWLDGSAEPVLGMIVRDSVRSLIEYQINDYPEEVISTAQENLNRLYDAFTQKYGLINNRGNYLAFAADESYFLLVPLRCLISFTAATRSLPTR